MGQNMSTTDRLLRTFVAAPLLVLVGVLVGPAAVLSWVCYILAAVMLGTSRRRWCRASPRRGCSRPRRGQLPVPRGRRRGRAGVPRRTSAGGGPSCSCSGPWGSPPVVGHLMGAAGAATGSQLRSCHRGQDRARPVDEGPAACMTAGRGAERTAGDGGLEPRGCYPNTLSRSPLPPHVSSVGMSSSGSGKGASPNQSCHTPLRPAYALTGLSGVW